MADLTEAPGAGDVTVSLGDTKVVLRCTPRAFFRLSRAYGGLFGPGTVGAAVLALNIDVMAEVMRAGANVAADADPKLPEKIYYAGALTVRDALSRYINNLANGGKPARTSDDGESDPLA